MVQKKSKSKKQTTSKQSKTPTTTRKNPHKKTSNNVKINKPKKKKIKTEFKSSRYTEQHLKKRREYVKKNIIRGNQIFEEEKEIYLFTQDPNLHRSPKIEPQTKKFHSQEQQQDDDEDEKQKFSEQQQSDSSSESDSIDNILNKIKQIQQYTSSPMEEEQDIHQNNSQKSDSNTPKGSKKKSSLKRTNSQNNTKMCVEIDINNNKESVSKISKKSIKFGADPTFHIIEARETRQSRSEKEASRQQVYRQLKVKPIKSILKRIIDVKVVR